MFLFCNLVAVRDHCSGPSRSTWSTRVGRFMHNKSKHYVSTCRWQCNHSHEAVYPHACSHIFTGMWPCIHMIMYSHTSGRVSTLHVAVYLLALGHVSTVDAQSITRFLKKNVFLPRYISGHRQDRELCFFLFERY